jgi:hypothetical protein
MIILGMDVEDLQQKFVGQMFMYEAKGLGLDLT